MEDKIRVYRTRDATYIIVGDAVFENGERSGREFVGYVNPDDQKVCAELALKRKGYTQHLSKDFKLGKGLALDFCEKGGIKVTKPIEQMLEFSKQDFPCRKNEQDFARAVLSYLNEKSVKNEFLHKYGRMVLAGQLEKEGCENSFERAQYGTDIVGNDLDKIVLASEDLRLHCFDVGSYGREDRFKHARKVQKRRMPIKDDPNSGIETLGDDKGLGVMGWLESQEASK